MTNQTSSKFLFFALAGFLVVLTAWLWLASAPLARADVQAQQPTVDIATVTGTPSGPVISVNTDTDQINVRSGPSTDYPQVGVLVAGQKISAIGRSPGGDWIQIVYSGVPNGTAWVYAFLVSAPGSTLPIIEPPATPTPVTTPTVDPTLAAQFNIESLPTRLPTFTAPAPLVIPTFTDETNNTVAEGVPIGLLIIGLGTVGLFGAGIAVVRRR